MHNKKIFLSLVIFALLSLGSALSSSQTKARSFLSEKSEVIAPQGIASINKQVHPKIIQASSKIQNVILSLQNAYQKKQTCSPNVYKPRQIRPPRAAFSYESKPILTPESFQFKRFMSPKRVLRYSGIAEKSPRLELEVEFKDYFYYIFRPMISRYLQKHKANETDYSDIPTALNYSIEDLLKTQPNLANLIPSKVEIELLQPNAMNPMGRAYIRKGKIPKIKWHVLKSDSPFLFFMISTKFGPILHFKSYNTTLKRWHSKTTFFHTKKNRFQYQNIKKIKTKIADDIDDFKAYCSKDQKFQLIKIK